MIDVGAIVDFSGVPARPSYCRLAGEVRSFAFDRPAPPDPATLPRGDGHVVLAVPGFFTGDSLTAPLRRFLGRCGYRAHGWGLGPNFGPTRRLGAGLRARLAALVALEGGPVSLIGVSLGGVMVRDLAHERPEDVLQVITLVSPIHLPVASTLAPLALLTAPLYPDDLDLARPARPLPVPAMAVYTKDDGVVPWKSCIDPDPGCEMVEVAGSHIAICRNPDALRAVAKRLGNVPALRAARGAGAAG